MSCDRVTDCKYNCPPRMSDGRHYTDYRPRCARNYEELPKPMSAYDYRQFLMENAEQLITQHRENAWVLNACGPCANPSTMLPEQHVQVCDGKTCSFPVNDPNGLGVGRKYGREAPEGYSANTPQKSCATPIMDMNLYPIDGKVGKNYENLTGPQAGWPFQN
jgi:hypothetical protein